MRRLIWLPIAGFLLIAGAAVATAAPGLAHQAASFITGTLTNATTPDPSASPTPTTGTGNPSTNGVNPTGPLVAKDDVLQQVLADLVTQGVITQAQSDAITNALQTKVNDLRTQEEQRRAQMQQEWQQIQGFLQDGVITQAEIDQLPADSPLRQAFDSIAKNGQITTDQLQQLGPGFGLFGPGFGPGGPGGPEFHKDGPSFGPWDNDSGSSNNSVTPSASPSTTQSL